MENKIKKPRDTKTHLDWITLSGTSSTKKGQDLLEVLQQAIDIKPNEHRRTGYGRGWYFEQYNNLGLRISATNDGELRVELQGLFFNGSVANYFQEFLRIVESIKKIKDTVWRLSRMDVAIDLYGVDIQSAFPDPNSDEYNWDFSYNQEVHKIKTKKGLPIITGYTVRKQRWKLTVYDKRQELLIKKTHPIKRAFFNLLMLFQEPLTRIELRVSTAEALSRVQGVLTSSCEESDLCKAILKHWGRYHRIKTKDGKDEDRFHKLFRNFEAKTFERVEREKIENLRYEYHEIKLRDMARAFLRYGFNEYKTSDELARIVKEQIEWLQENENVPNPENKPAEPEATTAPSGKGVS